MLPELLIRSTLPDKNEEEYCTVRSIQTRSSNQEGSKESVDSLDNWFQSHEPSDLRQAQLNDVHLGPVLLWREESPDRPDKSSIKASSRETRYMTSSERWVQFESHGSRFTLEGASINI